MQTQLLSHELNDLFGEIDRLASRHREAVEYAAASERMAFLFTRVQALQRALRELHAVGGLLRAMRGDQSGDKLWRQTCHELRERTPTEFRTPGRALVTGNLDLLELIDYTGASTALVVERRDYLVRVIAQSLGTRQNAIVSPATESVGVSPTIASIHEAITQIVDADGAIQAETVAYERGWVE